ncbi:MAG: hypothetical protein D6805_05820 [Planctomycetota bacterium]|nr:MAG: hypothetical protein D6805_05820 [Planctomycetota bacterium]
MDKEDRFFSKKDFSSESEDLSSMETETLNPQEIQRVISEYEQSVSQREPQGKGADEGGSSEGRGGGDVSREGVGKVRERGKEPELLLRLVWELYRADPGRLMNVLKSFFMQPFEEGDEVDIQRKKLVMFLCASREKNILMFLDFMRLDDRFQLSDRLKEEIYRRMKSEGLLV